MTHDRKPKPGLRIDLNSDMGESDDPAQIAADLALLDIVTSANIACGGHAGDEASMARTIRAAMQRGVAIGAHPGHPDRANFGRADMDMKEVDIELAVFEQIAALDRVARSLGATLSHVKPHGALYHAAMTRAFVAGAIARAAAKVNHQLVLVGLAGTPGLDRWGKLGCRIAAEAFADRRYEADGSLRSRTKPDAVMHDVDLAVQQAVNIAQGRGVVTLTGEHVAIRADTICIHSDTPGAAAVARAVRSGLERAGVAVRRPTA